MTENEFIKYALDLNINITDEMQQKLKKYYELLISWNEKINLTAITDKNEVYLKHFYDSLTIAKVIDLEKENTLCDIGTGAGLPGIVLKICFPNLKITLIDSLNKRVNFLNEVIKELELKDIVAIHARAEDYAKENREKFDIVTARAVASLNILLEYAIPLVKINKYFIALKGHEEINSYQNVFKLLSVKIDDIKEFNLPKENSFRKVIKIVKKQSTPLKYPRKNAEIKKNPLN